MSKKAHFMMAQIEKEVEGALNYAVFAVSKIFE
jgi:hypothetical protein